MAKPLPDQRERIPVTLTDDQWGLILRALEYRYDPEPDHPEWRAAIDTGVEITRALENAWHGREPERRARQMREEVERRMSRAYERPSRFSDTDRGAVESVLADVIRESQLATDEERLPTPEQVEKVREIHQTQRAVRGPEPAAPRERQAR